MAGVDIQRDWARRGASVRLAEIDRERAAILKAFPELKGGGKVNLNGSGRPKRRFSAAARRRMSAGMRKYWARRKARAAKTEGKS
jgi:hypothetical protein